MNGKCFEIGTIQAFLDGETSPDVSLRLTDHVASCDACALALAQADEESSAVFSMLERELNVLVPTQRLWTRINESIAVEESSTSLWTRIVVFLQTSLANPSLTAAAGLLLVLGMFAIVMVNRDNSPIMVADRFSNAPQTGSETAYVDTTGSDALIASPTAPSVGVSNLRPEEIKALVGTSHTGRPAIRAQRADYREPVSADGYLPGEESYVKTIADLKENVDGQKDAVLSPSTRVSYERDMAVVNNSIDRMRKAVKKNPKNQAVRQVLYSSYQDKIDLLNSVAQREELIASLK